MQLKREHRQMVQKGYIFDDFPRDVEQAEKMEEENIEYDYVVNLEKLVKMRLYED